MEAAIISTYRCPSRCCMCHIWKHPTQPGEEFKPSLLEKLPKLNFANITGGEPTLRDDLPEIVAILLRKSRRVVISTNGYFTEKIVDMAKKFKGKNLGIRISMDGLSAANDALRGMKDGFDHGLRTLLELRRSGLKDIGFGMTVSDRNIRDMIELYRLAEAMGVEFATAAAHNSYYFHKWDNKIANQEEMVACFQELIRELLKTGKVKNWFRAYFNYGLINHIKGNPRLLPCGAGEDIFFLDPWGEIRPCNGLKEASIENSMGNLGEKNFEDIWHSEKARRIKASVKSCPENCWMIGTASPAIKKNIFQVFLWVIKNKSRRISII